MSVMTRREFLQLLGLSTAGAVLASCAPGSVPAPTTAPTVAPTQAVKVRPTVRLTASAGQGLFEPPQPFGYRTGPAYARSNFLFDTLLWRDSTANPIPWLADKWSSNGDGTEWTFNLRSGVKFQDGKPLTTDDVVFSYQYIAANATSWWSTLVDVLKDIKATDDHTIVITLKTAYAPFLWSIAAQVPIIPKAIWSSVKDPVKFSDPTRFLGSGPYTLQSFSEADSSFLFVANDNYWLGKPYVQRIEFDPAADELVALKAGNLDIAAPSVTEGFSSEALNVFKGDSKYAIIQAPGEGTVALHFNLSRGEPYSNAKFRQAIIYAIDRQELVKRVLDGNGDPGSAGFLAPSNPWAPPKDIEPYAYNPDKAKALLDQAGLVDKNGTRLPFQLLFASTSARTAEFIRSQLANIGVTVELQAVDPGTANQRQGEGNFAVSLVSYGGLGGDPDFMRRAFDSPDQAKFWWKAWGYKNPDFSKLATQQLSTLNEAKRRDLVVQMQRIIANDVPLIPLYYPTRLLVYVPSVLDNWYYTPNWTPLHTNKHIFVTGNKTGLTIRS